MVKVPHDVAKVPSVKKVPYKVAEVPVENIFDVAKVP